MTPVLCHLLDLTGFRNYHRLALEPPTGGCLFIGPNGAGKSNLLEAIGLVSAGRGSNPSAGLELIRIGQDGERADFARVRARVAVGDRLPQLLEMVVAPGDGGRVSRRAWIEGRMRPRRDLIGRLPLVQFEPRDLELVGGQPAARRRFANWAIGQADGEYVAALGDFERSRRQRNALLRELALGPGKDPDRLDYWDDLLDTHGGVLVRARAGWLEQMSTRAQSHFARLARGPESVSLEYRPALAELAPGSLAEALRRTRQREIAVGNTLIGPHRDDFRIHVDGRLAAQFASRGQQRLAVLCVKLALLDWLTEKIGQTPVLSLDEVFSELDPHHRNQLAEILPADAQLFLAAADRGLVPDSLVERCQPCELADGDVKPL